MKFSYVWTFMQRFSHINWFTNLCSLLLHTIVRNALHVFYDCSEVHNLCQMCGSVLYYFFVILRKCCRFFPDGEAILGPSTPNVKTKMDLPIEMMVGRQKMRPGSGFLSVKVITDGPTRVLQIMDVTHQVTFWMVVLGYFYCRIKHDH